MPVGENNKMLVQTAGHDKERFGTAKKRFYKTRGKRLRDFILCKVAWIIFLFTKESIL